MSNYRDFTSCCILMMLFLYSCTGNYIPCKLIISKSYDEQMSHDLPGNYDPVTIWSLHQNLPKGLKVTGILI